jgi:hypothetical protein
MPDHAKPLGSRSSYAGHEADQVGLRPLRGSAASTAVGATRCTKKVPPPPVGLGSAEQRRGSPRDRRCDGASIQGMGDHAGLDDLLTRRRGGPCGIEVANGSCHPGGPCRPHTSCGVCQVSLAWLPVLQRARAPGRLHLHHVPLRVRAGGVLVARCAMCCTVTSRPDPSSQLVAFGRGVDR